MGWGWAPRVGPGPGKSHLFAVAPRRPEADSGHGDSAPAGFGYLGAGLGCRDARPLEIWLTGSLRKNPWPLPRTFNSFILGGGLLVACDRRLRGRNLGLSPCGFYSVSWYFYFLDG